MEELKILQKTYDMIKYGNQCLLQFPRAERYALAVEIKQSMYKILRLIIQANKSRHRVCRFPDLSHPSQIEKIQRKENESQAEVCQIRI